jgi:rhodanese-related sulfurtransferase
MATTISRAPLAHWVERGEDFDLVDTLPAKAYARHHLPGAIHIISDEIATEAPRRLPDKERTIVVYCSNAACQRSARAAARLKRLRYRDVREYVEARQDSQAAGLPTKAGADPEAAA